MRRRTLLTGLGVALHGAVARAVGERPTTIAPPPRSLVRLAGSCILAGFRHNRLPGELTSMLADGALGGVILAQENVTDASQLRWVTAQLRLMTPPGNPPPLIAADQEGGPVSHLTPPLPWLPSLTTLGRIDDVALTRRVGVALGQSLMDVGVNFDLAPVLDVRTNRANNVVLGRVFGDDPQRVARHAVPFIEALRSTGILACAKHFPGHGDTREDSHRGLPRVAHGVERLDAVELVPFRAAASVVPAVMVAHVVYEGIDRQRPATLSRDCAHGLLREHMGYEGVSVSDDLEMTPIRVDYGVAAGAVQSMAAGCDLLTIAHTPAYARSAAHAMAARASVDERYLARLEEAAARVRRMRELLTIPVAVRARREDVPGLLREVRARAEGATRRYRDPTR